MMTQQPFDASELAVRIIQYECAGPPDASTLAAAADAGLQKMQDGLASLLGKGGVFALASRALKIAQRQYPELCSVSIGEDRASFQGVAQALNGLGAEQQPLVAAAILQQMITLLIALMGDHVALIPARQIWPTIFALDAQPGSMEIPE